MHGCVQGHMSPFLFWGGGLLLSITQCFSPGLPERQRAGKRLEIDPDQATRNDGVPPLFALTSRKRPFYVTTVSGRSDPHTHHEKTKLTRILKMFTTVN